MGLCLGKSIPTPDAGGTSSPPPPCCPDLPPEIAGLILCRLVFHNDWLSFAAVCRSWALAAQHHRTLLPPAVPCINLGDGEYLSLTDGKVRLLNRPSDCRVEASFGSWLLYEHEPSGRCFLRDPFASDTPNIDVPCRYNRRTATDRGFNFIKPRPNGGYDVIGTCNPPREVLSSINKIVVQSPQLIVAMFDGAPFNSPPAVNFTCFRPGMPPFSWSHAAVTSRYHHQFHDFYYMDVAFHHGKIFAVGWTGDLFAHEFLHGEALSQSRVKHVIVSEPRYSPNYAKYHLLTSSDKQKLLMVRWSIPEVIYRAKMMHYDMNLHVFEADLDRGQWSEVKDLGHQVLFVGTNGSRALAVEAGSSERYHGRFGGGNRVFLLGHEWAWAWAQRHFPCRCSCCRKLVNNGIPNYCVYYMMSGKTSLVSHGKGHNFGSMKSSRSEWFFPSG